MGVKTTRHIENKAELIMSNHNEYDITVNNLADNKQRLSIDRIHAPYDSLLRFFLPRKKQKGTKN